MQWCSSNRSYLNPWFRFMISTEIWIRFSALVICMAHEMHSQKCHPTHTRPSFLVSATLHSVVLWVHDVCIGKRFLRSRNYLLLRKIELTNSISEIWVRLLRQGLVRWRWHYSEIAAIRSFGAPRSKCQARHGKEPHRERQTIIVSSLLWCNWGPGRHTRIRVFRCMARGASIREGLHHASMLQDLFATAGGVKFCQMSTYRQGLAKLWAAGIMPPKPTKETVPLAKDCPTCQRKWWCPLRIESFRKMQICWHLSLAVTTLIHWRTPYVSNIEGY